jgi:hypothetical protein
LQTILTVGCGQSDLLRVIDSPACRRRLQIVYKSKTAQVSPAHDGPKHQPVGLRQHSGLMPTAGRAMTTLKRSVDAPRGFALCSPQVTGESEMNGFLAPEAE